MECPPLVCPLSHHSALSWTLCVSVVSLAIVSPEAVQFSRSVVSSSLWPHGMQHTRPPCSSPTPGVYSNSCPSSRWCHPVISSSVVPFSSHLQSFPASGSFQMSQFFTSGSQSIGVSASASVHEYSGLISLRMDWLDLLAVQGTLKSLLQQHGRWCYQGLIQTRGERASMHNLRDIQNFHLKGKVSLTLHFFALINSSFKMNVCLPLPTTTETTFRTLGHSHLCHSGCYQRNRISKLYVYLYVYNSMDRGAW